MGGGQDRAIYIRERMAIILIIFQMNLREE